MLIFCNRTERLPQRTHSYQPNKNGIATEQFIEGDSNGSPVNVQHTIYDYYIVHRYQMTNVISMHGHKGRLMRQWMEI